MLDQYLKPTVKRGATYYAIINLVVGILMLIPLLNCIVAPAACLVWLILPFAVGWLVAQWDRTAPAARTALTVQSSSPYVQPAVDGGVASGVGALVSGIIVLILGLLLGGLFATIGSAGETGAAGQVLGGFALGAAGGVFQLVFSTILAAIFGAIGGAIYVVFNQRRATT